MSDTVSAPSARAPEYRSGLDPWVPAQLPAPPDPRGLAWIGVVGPGVIVLGASIGSGEFLLGPAAFVRYGLVLLWVTGAAVFLQTIFNTELMRYTIATGEPIFSGFMRTRPSSTFWAWFYAGLYFLQIGWPAWAGAAAGAMFFLFSGSMAAPEDARTVYLIGVVTFLTCAGLLLVGRRIERTLEILNWILVVSIMSGFLVLALLFVAPETWLAALAGFIGLDPVQGAFRPLPEGVDFFLIGAVAGYSGAGGVINLTLSNWARDKGYGMSQLAGYIPAAVGGEKVQMSHTGYVFDPTPEAMERWRGWWRIVRADQWVVYFTGAMLGMVLPGVLYVTFLDPGTDIRGLGIAAELAQRMRGAAGPLVGMTVALMGVWILFKTQLDLMDGMTRAVTDILWTGSRRIRSWKGGDVRLVYYCILGIVVAWGILASSLTQPIVLLQLSANTAGIVFIISSLHLLYVNTTLLPVQLRPPLWRRVGLVAMALFYGVFVTLWLTSLV